MNPPPGVPRQKCPCACGEGVVIGVDYVGPLFDTSFVTFGGRRCGKTAAGEAVQRLMEGGFVSTEGMLPSAAVRRMLAEVGIHLAPSDEEMRAAGDRLQAVIARLEAEA